MKQVKIIRNQGNGRAIALVPLVIMESEELHQWRIINEDIIQEAKHLIETFNVSLKYYNESELDTIYDSFSDKLNTLNSLTTNI